MLRQNQSSVTHYVYLIALIGVATIACLLGCREPRAIDGKVEGFADRIAREYTRLGLDVPSDTCEYYASVAGSPCRCLDRGVRALSNPLNPKYISKADCDWSVEQPFLVCVVTYEETTKRFLLWSSRRTTSQRLRYAIREVPERSRMLMANVSAGTVLWKRSLVDTFLIGTKSDPIPAVAFDRPSSQKELDEYWRWLEKMVGSLDRFRDDWGHRINMSIERGSEPAILVVRSAGPDGKWDTNDDLVLKRKATTGTIVERIGFAEDSSPQSTHP